MSSDYQPQFITNNYTIQINILYNAKDIKDDDDAKEDDSDSLNSSYYIINNMKDILLREFSNEQNYKSFKEKYNTQDAGNPLYMINSSFYIDTNVMETIRKVTTPKFPSYARNKQVQNEEFLNYFKKFNSNSTVSSNYKDELNTTFKDLL